MTERVYLDHNASSPLVPPAYEAMINGMAVAGNPSSVHTEGRAARAIIERARGEILEALGAQGYDLVFTSGATEASALAHAGRDLRCAASEHEAVRSWARVELPMDQFGKIDVGDPATASVAIASGETGVIQTLPEGVAVCDLTQGFGKIPFAAGWMKIGVGFLSAHKIGGPRGIGALIAAPEVRLTALLRGGGQEQGHRSGTQNVAGIAGFAAAARHAQHRLAGNGWSETEALRNRFEERVASRSRDTIFVGKDAPRLPNTSYFITPGWKAETQVMAMDLAGFAVSAGSACSSGKVRSNPALLAMGFSQAEAQCALRVSLGADTTQDQMDRFTQAWIDARDNHSARQREGR